MDAVRLRLLIVHYTPRRGRADDDDDTNGQRTRLINIYNSEKTICVCVEKN